MARRAANEIDDTDLLPSVTAVCFRDVPQRRRIDRLDGRRPREIVLDDGPAASITEARQRVRRRRRVFLRLRPVTQTVDVLRVAVRVFLTHMPGPRREFLPKLRPCSGAVEEAPLRG